jgi:hypothetical protein
MPRRKPQVDMPRWTGASQVYQDCQPISSPFATGLTARGDKPSAQAINPLTGAGFGAGGHPIDNRRRVAGPQPARPRKIEKCQNRESEELELFPINISWHEEQQSPMAKKKAYDTF